MGSNPTAPAGIAVKSAALLASAIGSPESRFIDGPAGRIDSRWHGPTGGAPALVLHPHPLFGGTMGSRLVYDVTTALADAGFRAVRFDFRGVGRSDGEYAWGDGESADAAAVYDALRAEAGREPAVVGYSFGGGVAARLATLRPAARLVCVGTQPSVFQSRLAPVDDAARVRCPAHLVVGDRDEYVSVAETRALAAAFRPAAGVSVIEGAAHFLEPSRNADAVAAVLAALRPTD